MTMTDLILKKREGGTLSREEIRWMVDGYTAGRIPDYQMSAMLMAVCFRDMNEEETLELTLAMRDSGDRMDLSGLGGVRADKHSTGGVGDKTSLLLCPMLACCGVTMAKMSGRGLGHTGGTVDKLESFPGFCAEILPEKFLATAGSVGFVIAGQSGNLCPADKKLYALRDVTGTVSARSLIVSSIMSKKLAAGADVIVLDVKTGSGAFMQTQAEAFALAEEMVKVGRLAGKKVEAVVTDMDEPLGRAVGNALEVKEALAALRGEGPEDLTELCLTLGSRILLAGGLERDEAAARARLWRSIRSGAALRRFADFIGAMGGDAAAVYDPGLLPRAPVQLPVRAQRSGWLSRVDAQGVGLVSLHLGGGRATKESVIDLSVGLVMNKKVGDPVAEGECLAVIHAATEKAAEEAADMLRGFCTVSDERPEKKAFIKGVVTA